MKNASCVPVFRNQTDSLSLSIYIYILEPKWPLLWLEKALFWGVDLQKIKVIWVPGIYIYILPINSFHPTTFSQVFFVPPSVLIIRLEHWHVMVLMDFMASPIVDPGNPAAVGSTNPRGHQLIDWCRSRRVDSSLWSFRCGISSDQVCFSVRSTDTVPPSKVEKNCTFLASPPCQVPQVDEYSTQHPVGGGWKRLRQLETLKLWGFHRIQQHWC